MRKKNADKEKHRNSYFYRRRYEILRHAMREEPKKVLKKITIKIKVINKKIK